jgi:hypothetical protein
MERRVKGLAAGETERECARDREWLKMELASIVKRPFEEGLTILGFLENLM